MFQTQTITCFPSTSFLPLPILFYLILFSPNITPTSCLYISFHSTLYIRSIISASFFFFGVLDSTIFLPYPSLHISFLFKTSEHFKEVLEKMTKLYVFKLSCLLLPQNILLRCPRLFSFLSQRAECSSDSSSPSTSYLIFNRSPCLHCECYLPICPYLHVLTFYL